MEDDDFKIPMGGNSPLHIACIRKHQEIARVLLESCCVSDLSNLYLDTPLHIATRYCLPHLVSKLIAAKADVNASNRSGNTPLHIASRGGYLEIVRMLISAGAIVDKQNSDGVTPELLALANSQSETAHMLSRLKSPELQTKYITQLHTSNLPFPTLVLKFFGNSRVGKTTLIESLQAGRFRRLLSRLGSLTASQKNSSAATNKIPGNTSSLIINSNHHSTMMNDDVTNAESSYIATKGVSITNIELKNITTGSVTAMDFSGAESYRCVYDHFIGDPNALHLIVFRLSDAIPDIFHQVKYWISFIKARIAPQQSIAEFGAQPEPVKIILIATHADQVRLVKNSSSLFQSNADEISINEQHVKKNVRGEYVSREAFAVFKECQRCFGRYVDICSTVFVMDARDSASSDIMALKDHFSQSKNLISQTIPFTNGLLEETQEYLPIWRESLRGYPVLSWHSFINQVRLRINPLASDEHIEELAQFLQLAASIFLIYVNSRLEPDLVVLDPDWLGSGIIGEILDRHRILENDLSEIFDRKKFKSVFPETSPDNSAELMQALEICTEISFPYDESLGSLPGSVSTPESPDTPIDYFSSSKSSTFGTVGSRKRHHGKFYEFPAINFTAMAPGLWEPFSEQEHEDLKYGGVRINVSRTDGRQLASIFPRIQIQLRRIVEQEHDDTGFTLMTPQESPVLSSRVPPGNSNNNNTTACQEIQKSSTLYGNISPASSALIQWYGGSKLYGGQDIESMITLHEPETCADGSGFQNIQSLLIGDSSLISPNLGTSEYIEIQTRGPRHKATILFHVMDELVVIVEQLIVDICPGLCVERHYLSPRQLWWHKYNIVTYPPRLIMMMELESHGGSTSFLSEVGGTAGTINEDFVDVICFGSHEVRDSIVLGVDLHINQICIHTRLELCSLLDGQDPMGRDWCLLAVMLGIDIAMIPELSENALQSKSSTPSLRIKKPSKTDLILTRWGESLSSTIGKLLLKLQEMGRHDAVEVIMSHAPLFSNAERISESTYDDGVIESLNILQQDDDDADDDDNDGNNKENKNKIDSFAPPPPDITLDLEKDDDHDDNAEIRMGKNASINYEMNTNQSTISTHSIQNATKHSYIESQPSQKGTESILTSLVGYESET